MIILWVLTIYTHTQMQMCLNARLSSSKTNWSKIFFQTCRPPVCVWTRFMHCWFNGLLPERLSDSCSLKSKPRKGFHFLKKVHHSRLLNLKRSAWIWPGSGQPISSQGLTVTYGDAILRDTSKVLCVLLDLQKDNMKSCISQIMEAILVCSPCQISFPDAMPTR